MRFINGPFIRCRSRLERPRRDVVLEQLLVHYVYYRGDQRPDVLGPACQRLNVACERRWLASLGSRDLRETYVN